MMRFFLISAGALLLASTGAFFLFVSLMSIAAAVLIAVGLMLMFGLGFQVRGHSVAPSETVANQA